MSNSVVPAAAVAHAKQLVRNKKLPKRTQDQKPTQDEQLPAEKDHDATHAVQTQQSEHVQTTMSDTTLSADFSFMGALAASAEASASLAIAQDDGSMSDDGDGAGGTVLLVGAVGLVGLGVAVLAGGGGKSNDPPAFAADSQSVTTKEDVAVSGTAVATDPDGDPLSYSVSTAATKGTATVANDGKFTYTPSADFNGKDSFVVTANDGQGGTDTITINVTVDPVNDGPRADKTATTSLTTNEDTPAEVVIAFTDPEGNTPLGLPIVTDSTDNGTFVLAAGGGKGTYTPNANFNGKDSLTYTIADSLGAVTTQTVAITVTPVNDAPTVAETQTVNTQAGTAVTVTVAGTDVDGDALTYTAKADADPSGTITGGAGGTFTYTPNAGFSGTDTFVVTVDDGKGGTDTQSVTVNVGPTVKTVSIDIVGPNSTTPATVVAGDGIYNFTDNSTVDTDVRITGFGNNGADPDDKITVTGATSAQYNFGTGGADGKDLVISFVNSAAGAENLILIDDVLSGNALVFDYASAVTAVGFNFMTFA